MRRVHLLPRVFYIVKCVDFSLFFFNSGHIFKDCGTATSITELTELTLFEKFPLAYKFVQQIFLTREPVLVDDFEADEALCQILVHWYFILTALIALRVLRVLALSRLKARA